MPEPVRRRSSTVRTLFVNERESFQSAFNRYIERMRQAGFEIKDVRFDERGLATWAIRGEGDRASQVQLMDAICEEVLGPSERALLRSIRPPEEPQT